MLDQEANVGICGGGALDACWTGEASDIGLWYDRWRPPSVNGGGRNFLLLSGLRLDLSATRVMASSLCARAALGQRGNCTPCFGGLFGSGSSFPRCLW